MSAALTVSQLKSIEITERVASVLSLIGCAFIIGSFLTSKAFYKPINRLVCYAAFGNVMANFGTLISRSGIIRGGSLCNAQAFLIQMFMPADAAWTFAMAINVYLTFFYKYDARQLRKLEWKYILLCYGTPFIPAFVFFFVKNSSGTKVYGSAVLWCWIGIDWDWLRIAAFYGPAWLIIMLTMAIYIRCGKEIWEKRQQLKDFSGSTHEHNTPAVPMVSSPFMSTKTTEIHISTTPVNPGDDYLQASRDEENPSETRRNYDPYSVSVGTGPNSMPRPQGTQFTSTGQNTAYTNQHKNSRKAGVESNKAAISYAKISMLFFAAILITWVPSTVNRVYSLVYPERTSFALSYTAALVLPLQGFWNSIVYCYTSVPAIKALYSDIKDTLTSGHVSSSHSNPGIMERAMPAKSKNSSKGFDSLDDESTKSFARS